MSLSNPNTAQKKSIVLCISGLDPSGGAGIQADIETIFSLGCHGCSIVSVLTIQNSGDIKRISNVPADIIEDQFNCILQDMPISVIKVGMLGSVEQIQTLSKLFKQHPDIPVVLDPVFASGNGFSVSSNAMLEALQQQILPHCFLLTPNSLEARRLANLGIDGDLSECARKIQTMGCKNVLITGTHENEINVVHRLWQGEKLNAYANTRLDNSYHGSGCTLASALAALLAKHYSVEDAVKAALHFTFNSLQNAQALGKGQLIPDRNSKSD